MRGSLVCRAVLFFALAFCCAPISFASSAAEPSESESAAAVQALEAILAADEVSAEGIDKREFAHVPLTKEQAARARELLWQDHAARIAAERDAEIKNGVLKYGSQEM